MESSITFKANLGNARKVSEKKKDRWGNVWKLSIGCPSHESNTPQLELSCNEDVENNLWSCDASIDFTLDEKRQEPRRKTFSYAAKSLILWTADDAIRFDKRIFDVTIKIRSKERLRNFSRPDGNLTDVVLIVEDNEIHVSKQVLAMHSKVFHTMFFSMFQENGKREIELKELDYWEFLDLLNMVYPSEFNVDASNAAHLLRLADRFEMTSIIRKIETQLIITDSVPTVDKLKYAEDYKLVKLQTACLKTLKTSKDIIELKNQPNFDKLSNDFLALLFKKLAGLVQHQTFSPTSPPYSITSPTYGY